MRQVQHFKGTHDAPVAPTRPSRAPLNSPRASTAARALVAAAILAAVAFSGACANQPDRRQVDLPNPAEQFARAQDAFNQARQAERRGDKLRAVALYQQAVQAYGAFPGAWSNLGALYMDLGRNLEAKEALDQAVIAAPGEAAPYVNLGVLYQRLNYFADAARYYNDALLRDPGNLVALRESVHMDLLLDQITPTTSDRVRAALLRERDPRWMNALLRWRAVVDARLERETGLIAPGAPTPINAPVPDPAPLTTDTPTGLPTAAPTPGR